MFDSQFIELNRPVVENDGSKVMVNIDMIEIVEPRKLHRGSTVYFRNSFVNVLETVEEIREKILKVQANTKNSNAN